MSSSKETVFSIIRSTCRSITIDETQYEESLRDVGVDSLDFANILLEVEDHFSVKIPNEQVDELKTVKDIVIYIQNFQASSD